MGMGVRLKLGNGNRKALQIPSRDFWRYINLYVCLYVYVYVWELTVWEWEGLGM